MNTNKHIIILGGGTAGWMSAAAISKGLIPKGWRLTVIDSSKIPTVGVGEATIPHITHFNRWLGLDEAALIKKTNASFKLGIQFKDWGYLGSQYSHPFDSIKLPIDDSANSYEYLAYAKTLGITFDLDALSLAASLGLHNKFNLPRNNEFAYAYHIDSALYAGMLKKYSIARGANILDKEVTSATRCKTTGNIIRLITNDGEEITGDIFVDCSGFNSLLSKKTLETPFIDWSRWLLMDSAAAFPSPKLDSDAIPSHTVAQAMEHGWKWTIPLQSRTGNGVVFCSSLANEDAILTNAQAQSTKPIKTFSFTSGRVKNALSFNCFSVGLASGFLEPLESTSIYLIQVAAKGIVDYLSSEDESEALKLKYNHYIANEYEKVRDFIILHYSINSRTDSELWKHCQHMSLPDSLQNSIDVYRAISTPPDYESGLFLSPSWHTVFLGQGFIPSGVRRNISQATAIDLKAIIEHRQRKVQDKVSNAPSHSLSLRKLVL